MAGKKRRRRIWSDLEKKQLVEATFEPGATVAGVARDADVHENLLYKWRKELCRTSPQDLIPVAITPCAARPSEPGLIEIMMHDFTVRMHGDVDCETLRSVLDVLERRS